MLPQSRHKPLTAFYHRRENLRFPCRMQTPSQNLLLHKASSIHSTTHSVKMSETTNHQGGKIISLNQLKRLSINSVGIKTEYSSRNRRDCKIRGKKQNHIRMLGVNNFQSKPKDKNESLYDKSLRKAHSALRRKDFQETLNQINTQKLLISKKSHLNHEDEQRRLKTELCQPQSATIIIELKRLFNTRGQYNFVHNHYEVTQEQKKDEQILSTNHTYTQFNDRQRQLSNTSSLHNRSRMSKTANAERRKQENKSNNTKISKQNELIPWLKDTERTLMDLQFEPFIAN